MSTRFDAKRLQEEIDQSIPKMQNQGFELVTEEWGDVHSQCGCPLTLLCFDKLGLKETARILDLDERNVETNMAVALSAKLGMEITPALVTSFITGFDSMCDAYGDDSAVAAAQRAGLEIREKWLPYVEDEDDEDLEGDDY